MKTTLMFVLTRVLFVGLAGTAAAAPASDDSKSKPEYRTNVVFFEPEKFTDANDANRSERGRAEILDQLKTYIQQQAQAYVGEGQKLVVTITDVDLAGEFEPWRSQAHDVRIVRDIYPPRIELSFKLTGSNGETEKAGNRDLRDPMFQQTTMAFPSNDPYRYEKALLDSWLRTEFRTAKKT